MEIKDNKGLKNLVADHFSRPELEDNEALIVHIYDRFPNKQLLAVSHDNWTPWFVDIVNYLVVESSFRT